MCFQVVLAYEVKCYVSVQVTYLLDICYTRRIRRPPDFWGVRKARLPSLKRKSKVRLADFTEKNIIYYYLCFRSKNEHILLFICVLSAIMVNIYNFMSIRL